MPVSPPLREANLRRLTEKVHDVLIVGAGINGAASAAALAAAGVSTALVDRADFGGATSQESSNLVWGGIKYLESLELPLVWKLCRSRNELIRSYPANVREIRFFAPLERRPQGLRRAVPLLAAGTWLYWMMGRCATRPPRLLSRARIAAEEPSVDVAIVKGGVEYSDACLVDDDARFVFGFVRRALDQNAAATNYVEVRRCERDRGGVWRCTAQDRVSGRELDLGARVLINACGPWADELNAAAGVPTRTRHVFSKGIHLVVDRIASPDRVLVFFDETERMFFVLPFGERSLIGTTDTRVERPEAAVTDDDRRFLLDNVNRRRRVARPLGLDDVIAERCGVRPLAVERTTDAAAGAWTALSRKHVIEVDAARSWISIFGGKLTDCINVGDAVAAAVLDLGIRAGRRGATWYGEPPEATRREFLGEAARTGIDALPAPPRAERLSVRLWRRYGTNAFGMLDEIGRDGGMAEPAIEATELRRCELHFAARAEMVVRLEDLLRRRTHIALVRRRDELARAAGLREVCDLLAGARGDAMFDEFCRG